jgi:hypothetical protein
VEAVIDAAKVAATREGLSLSAFANQRLTLKRRLWPTPLLDLLGSLRDEPLEAPNETLPAAGSVRSGS